jgi:uncharacterized PurR-regulated membrane protein YhhQ (DUF165 family)
MIKKVKQAMEDGEGCQVFILLFPVLILTCNYLILLSTSIVGISATLALNP